VLRRDETRGDEMRRKVDETRRDLTISDEISREDTRLRGDSGEI